MAASALTAHFRFTLFLLVNTFILPLPAPAQKVDSSKTLPDRRDALKAIDTNLYANFKRSYPITSDTLNKYPDSITVEGQIVDYTLGATCGYFCGCGTLKIRINQKLPNYARNYVYVGVPCLSFLPDSLKNQQHWVLFKIALNDRTCFWTQLFVNKFDTKGIPFYSTYHPPQLH
jgi:hypothetical protein